MSHKLRAVFLPFAFAIVFSAEAAQDLQVRTIEGWGHVVDPLEDCRIVERDGTVSITVPGAYRDLLALPTFNNSDAPRIVQDVEGDFTLQVRVRRFEVPGAKTAVSKESPYSYVSSGLLVWQDRKNFLRLQRGANGDNRRVFIHANQFSGGRFATNTSITLPDEDTFLRVERNGDKLVQSFSTDGQTWTTVQPKGKEAVLPALVKVGIFTINATNREITHEFAEFKLTTK